MLAVSFLSGEFLWLLLLVPLMVVAYLAGQRRRARYAERFASAALLPTVVPRSPDWRRHVPPVVYLVSLVALLVAVARPVIVTADPTQQATVMLAVDVSGSMIATDVRPTRLDAAESSAQSFIDKLPRQIKVGLVAFSSQARVITSPTTNRKLVRQGLDSLTADGATAMGEGILAALRASAAPSTSTGSPTSTTSPTAPANAVAPRVILLLSDGKNTVGTDPLTAADQAVAANVRISTIALGTPDGVAAITSPGGRVQEVPVPPDPDILQAIAQRTGGTFFQAPSAQALRSVYASLGSKLAAEKHRHEITAWFAGAALALVVAGGVLALVWFSRLP